MLFRSCHDLTFVNKLCVGTRFDWGDGSNFCFGNKILWLKPTVNISCFHPKRQHYLWSIYSFSPRRYWDIEILRYSHPDDIEGEVAKGVENDHHNQHFHKLQVTTMETWIRKLMKMMIDCDRNTILNNDDVFHVRNNQE